MTALHRLRITAARTAEKLAHHAARAALALVVCLSIHLKRLRWEKTAGIGADSAAQRRHEVSPAREHRVAGEISRGRRAATRFSRRLFHPGRGGICFSIFSTACITALFTCSLLFASATDKKSKNTQPVSRSSLQQFIQRVQGEPVATTTALGSLWPLQGSQLTDLATDYKARRLNDLVIISIVEQTLAQASGAVAAQRDFTSGSGVTAIAGSVNTAPVNPLYGLNSSSTLKGTGTANSQSLLQANISGRVVAVLPNGNLVVEAERQVTFNQQTQTIVLRGVVRPGDISSSNSVPSTSLSDLELELKGKGVVSDATRQPNVFVRLLMKLLNF